MPPSDKLRSERGERPRVPTEFLATGLEKERRSFIRKETAFPRELIQLKADRFRNEHMQTMDSAMRSMGRESAVMARSAADLAQICRVEASRTMHPQSRATLLQMAAEYELLAEREGETGGLGIQV